MDELSMLIKKSIKSKYGSTRAFSEELGIPQTTIVSSIKNGVGGTSFSTVCKMCNALDIKLINGIYPARVTEGAKDLIIKMANLDEKGLHTVATILEMEYTRCKNEEAAVNKAVETARREIELKNNSTDDDSLSTEDVKSLLKSF